MCIGRALGSARTLRHLRYRIDFVSLSRVEQGTETRCKAREESMQNLFREAAFISDANEQKKWF